jgi:hypothetical protein
VTRTAVAALALVVAGLAAACDDDPKPRIGPPESTSPAPSGPSGTPEALSPEETVRAWVEARNRAVQTGDVKDVYDLSTPDCTACANSVEPVRNVYDEGGRFETEGWQVRSVRRAEDFTSTHSLAAALLFTAGRTIPSAGAQPVTYDAERHIVLFTVSRSRGLWKIDHFAFSS